MMFARGDILLATSWKILFLRLVDVFRKLDVNSPNPPIFRELDGEVATLLPSAPVAQLGVALFAEHAEEHDEFVVPVMIARYQKYRRVRRARAGVGKSQAVRKEQAIAVIRAR